MCGITGWAGPNGGTPEVLRAMTNCLIHRGPDEDGYFFNHEVALGMRRLSIIDVADGHQPVWSEDENVVAVFNGEIYNFRELFKLLTDKGHKLNSRADSEVIPHLYQEYGPRFVTHLRGMFAIALFDRDSQTFVLARDRAGKKPLYYSHIGKNLFFGSEAKALLANPKVPRRVDLAAIDMFLAYAYVPHPMSAFEGINKLPPAHYLTFRNGQTELTRYWQLDYTPKRISEKQALAELPEILQEAVNVRMISERPLGVFLSGGVDSSLVTALMQRKSSSQVKTYSIGFEDPRYDERKWSQKVAAHIGTDHTELVVKPDVVDVIHKLTDYFDEPFADSSAIPSYYVAKMAREHVVVVLNGDGGDESFGGYPRYAVAAAFQQFRGLHSILKLGQPLISRAGQLTASTKIRKLASVLSEHDILGGFLRAQCTVVGAATRERLWRAGVLPEHCLAATSRMFLSWVHENPSARGGNVALSTDVASYLPGDLLTKIDITTMSQSLEGRSPYLDSVVMQYAANLPFPLKVKGKETKYLLKKLATRYLPEDVIYRPKQGFGAPIDGWLRGPMRPLLLESMCSTSSSLNSYFNLELVRPLIDANTRSYRESHLLWSLVTLRLWLNKWNF